MYKEKILKPVNDKLPKVTWRDVERSELERIGGDLAEVTTNARSIHDLEQGKPGQVGGDILESVGLPRSSGELREMLLSWWNDIYDDVKRRTIGSDFSNTTIHIKEIAVSNDDKLKQFECILPLNSFNDLVDVQSYLKDLQP